MKELPYIKPILILDRMKQFPYCFLLESSLRDDVRGRFSFIGCNPFLTITCRRGQVEVSGVENYVTDSNPFDVVKHFLKLYSFQNDSEYPPFIGGAVGYFGYDLRLFIEKLPHRNRNDLDIPDLVLCFYDSVVIVDGKRQRCTLSVIRNIRPKGSEPNLEEIISNIDVEAESEMPQIKLTGISVESDFSKSDYVRAAEKVKQYIAAGEIFQVNLSQRLHADVRVEPLQLYKRLREINPAPFSAYLDFGDVKIISSSPERFLKVANGVVETRPIKGTRPRGLNDDDDSRLANQLVSSQKDRAENLMIVDLLRNDLGKVCEYGSISVSELFGLETHPTVFHLVSTVTGRIRDGVDCVDVLKACFPGGSITGAPKIRAMEIIDELEPVTRGVYTGCIGYIGFNGNMDTNIAIRTIVVKDERAYFHVGSGIVADSDPEAEYAETLDKAKALVQSVEGTAPDR